MLHSCIVVHWLMNTWTHFLITDPRLHHHHRRLKEMDKARDGENEENEESARHVGLVSDPATEQEDTKIRVELEHTVEKLTNTLQRTELRRLSELDAAARELAAIETDYDSRWAEREARHAENTAKLHAEVALAHARTHAAETRATEAAAEAATYRVKEANSAGAVVETEIMLAALRSELEEARNEAEAFAAEREAAAAEAVSILQRC